MSSFDKQESELVIPDVSPVLSDERIYIKMEDTLLLEGDKASVSSPIAMTAVVKVENDIPSEDENNFTDTEPGNQYSALLRTESPSFPRSSACMSGEKVFVKMEDGATNLSTPDLATVVKVEKEDSSEDTPNITELELENLCSTLKRAENSTLFRPIVCTSSSDKMSVRASKCNTVDLMPAFKLVNEVSSKDTRNITGNARDLLQNAQDERVRIKVEKVDLNPENISTSAECISHYTDSSYAVESDISIKKEENLGIVEEVPDPLVDNHFSDSILNQEDSECDEKSFQTGSACDENSVWGPCQEDCCDSSSSGAKASVSESQKFRLHLDFLSNKMSASRISPPRCRDSFADAKLVNNNYWIKCKAHQFSQFQRSQTFYDSSIKLKKVSVVLEDLFPKNCRDGSATSRSFFICTFCPAKFRGKFELKLHRRNHTGEQPYACTYCPAKFSRKSNFKYHLKTHTGEKPFACTYCPSKFKKKSHMVRHLRTHTGEKPFICTHCPAKFRQSNNLKDHLKTHTGEKPFACTFCSTKFSLGHTLKDHLKIHTGEKPFACASCSAKFRTKSELKSHLRIHTNEKPFICTYCPAKFRQRHGLGQHLKIHIGKPFTFASRSAKCRRKSEVKTHLRTQTNEKPNI